MDETGRVELERVVELRRLVANAPTDLTFGSWLALMETLQEVGYGAYYDEFDPETRADSIRMNFMACVKELSEMTDEMGWKPWSSPQGWINREAVIDEGVDAMHFLANLLKHAQCTGPELTAAYKRKMLKNLDRQLAGYDVRVEKCGYCHRNLSEVPALDRWQLPAILPESPLGTGEIVYFCNKEHADLWRTTHERKD